MSVQQLIELKQQLERIRDTMGDTVSTTSTTSTPPPSIILRKKGEEEPLHKDVLRILRLEATLSQEEKDKLEEEIKNIESIHADCALFNPVATEILPEGVVEMPEELKGPFLAISGNDKTMWSAFLLHFYKIKTPSLPNDLDSLIKKGMIVVPFEEGGSMNYPVGLPCQAKEDKSDRFTRFNGTTGNCVHLRYCRQPTRDEIKAFLLSTMF